MGKEVHMLEYGEDGLLEDDDLTPLSQILIPLELASAFNIMPEPYRTPVDVNQATQNTLSILRGSQPPPSFFCNDDLSGTKKIQRTELMEDADSALRIENSYTIEDQSANTLKRPRLMWTPQLHKRFVDVVSHLGIKYAVPKTIMHMMNVEGLRRENVASHLQKYRLYQTRMQRQSNEAPSSSNQLFVSRR